MKVKKESEKVGLKLNLQKTKIMASDSITSCQIEGETVERVTDYFGGSKITADGDCSQEIIWWLLLGRKVMTNLDSILKSRDITLPTKARLVKAMVSSGHVWIWELDNTESWALKNWCFWTVVLRVSWTERRSNQLILKEISSEYSLEGLMLKLKLQYCGHLIQKNWLIGKDPGGRRRRGRQRMRWLDGNTKSMDVSLSKSGEKSAWLSWSAGRSDQNGDTAQGSQGTW